MAFKKNTAVTGFTVGLISSTDGSAITTGTPVGYYTIDGGTQTAIGDVTPVHEGNGQWSFDLTAAEMNGDIVGLVFTHASAITVQVTISTETKLASDLNDISTTQVNTEVDTALTDYDGPTNAEMEVRTISATAAANLEDTYDGTGYINDVAPSTQSQVGHLSTGSAAISTSASTAVITTGTETLTYLAAANRDGSYHEVDDVGGALDFYYEFDVGSTGVGTSVNLVGRLEGNGDSVDVFAYNWGSTSWDQVGTFLGSNSSEDVDADVNINISHTGTAGDEGKVRVRAYQPSGLTTATLFMDQIYINYAIVADISTLATAADLAVVDTNVDAVLVDTSTTIPAQITALNDISVTDILTTQMTESYASDGSAPTLAQALMLIQQSLGDFSITGTTVTVKEVDGTTTAATFTLDDGTNPTSTTRAS